jgi:hypothetical protein
MPCGMSLQLGWIPVRRTVNLDSDVNENDSIEVDIRLLPILDQKTLEHLVKEELEKRGWTKNEDGSLTKQFGEATAHLPADGTTITLGVQAETSVSVTATEDGAAPESDQKAQDAIEEKARKVAERKLDAAQDRARRALQRKNAEALLAVEADLRRDVDDSVNAVTKKALERRAATLGEIESVQERRDAEGGYELTITVKT